MNDQSKIHLADADNAYEDFGSSAYFVSLDYFEKKSGVKADNAWDIYSVINIAQTERIPESEHHAIYAVTDKHGKEKFGKDAHFIRDDVYEKNILSCNM